MEMSVGMPLRHGPCRGEGRPPRARRAAWPGAARGAASTPIQRAPAASRGSAGRGPGRPTPPSERRSRPPLLGRLRSLGERHRPVVGVLHPAVSVAQQLRVDVELLAVEDAPELQPQPVAEQLQPEDALELLREEVVHRPVEQLPLELVDTEPARERHENLDRLARDAHLLVARHVLQRAHVVEPIRQLHHHDPPIGRHRDQHLALVEAIPLGGGHRLELLVELADLAVALDD
eukprot:341627-Prymnesium_polylepis.2